MALTRSALTPRAFGAEDAVAVLDVINAWRATTRYSFRDGRFVWGIDDPIGDAEQLLCLLFPGTRLTELQFGLPDQISEDALDALRAIGDSVAVSLRLTHTVHDYLTRYTDASGEPRFGVDRNLTFADLVDGVPSFTTSVHFTLASLGFLKVFRDAIRRPALRDLVDETMTLAASRLTAALVGLVRSFAIHTFTNDSAAAVRLQTATAQDGRAGDATMREFESGLIEVRAGLRDAKIGINQPSDLDLGGVHFECGWSWAVVASAPRVELKVDGIPQSLGTAAAIPQLYTTALAVDAIRQLSAERTRILGLLDEEQQRLMRALELRAELTRAYWSRIGTFGDYRWAMERIPWPTTSGDESDHNNLLIAAVTTAELSWRRGDTDVDFNHLVRVLAALAHRHGIVRPPRAGGPAPDPGLAGTPVPVRFANNDPATYRAAGIGPLLFRTAVHAAATTTNEQLRARLDDLADLTWDHVVAARQARASDPASLRHFGDGTAPNWTTLFHLVQGLTMAAARTTARIPNDETSVGFIHQLLAEAEQMAREIERTAPEQQVDELTKITATLERVLTLADLKPGLATALLYQSLSKLDELAERRRDT